MSGNQPLYLGEAWGLYRECTTVPSRQGGSTATEFQPMALVGTLEQFTQGWQAALAELCPDHPSQSNTHHKTTSYRLFKYLGPDAPNAMAWCDEHLYASQGGDFGRYSVSIKTESDCETMWTDVAMALIGSDYFGDFQSLIAGLIFVPGGGTFGCGALQVVIKQVGGNVEFAALLSGILNAPIKAAGFVQLLPRSRVAKPTHAGGGGGLVSPSNTPLKHNSTPKMTSTKSATVNDDSPVPRAPSQVEQSTEADQTKITPPQKARKSPPPPEILPPTSSSSTLSPAAALKAEEEKEEEKEKKVVVHTIHSIPSPPSTATSSPSTQSASRREKLGAHIRESFANACSLCESCVATVKEVKQACAAESARKKKDPASWIPTEFPEATSPSGRFCATAGSATGATDLPPPRGLGDVLKKDNSGGACAAFNYAAEWQAFQKAHHLTPKTIGTASQSGSAGPDQMAEIGNLIESLMATWRVERDVQGYVVWVLGQSAEVARLMDKEVVSRGAVTLEERHHQENILSSWKAEQEANNKKEEEVEDNRRRSSTAPSDRAKASSFSGAISQPITQEHASSSSSTRPGRAVEKNTAAAANVAQARPEPASGGVKDTHSRKSKDGGVVSSSAARKSKVSSSLNSSEVKLSATPHAVPAAAKEKSKKVKPSLTPGGVGGSPNNKKEMERQQRNLAVMISLVFGSLFFGLVMATLYA